MSAPTRKQRLHRLALIAVVPVVLVAGFAFAGGWLGPARLSGGSLADALEYNAGKHEGYRRAHAKGLCFSGTFDANGAGAALSHAATFVPGRYPVVGRFSTGGSDPFATDGRNVFHAIGLQISTPDGQVWRMALDHTPIFPVATPEAFVALQYASKPDPATGKPDPALMKAYLDRHPETRAFQTYLDHAPLPDSFANGTYYSINVFRFINNSGQATNARWTLVPETPLTELDKTKLASLPPNYLFDEIAARLAKGPLQWRMQVTVAAPADVTNNATILWPEDRQSVNVGTLTIEHASSEEDGPCRDITFDPTILPSGVALSDDPLPAARSAAYAASFRRRAVEGPQPSAIGIVEAVGKTAAETIPAKGR